MLHPFFQNYPVKLFNSISFSKIQTPQGFIKKTNFSFKRCESTCNNQMKAFYFPSTTRDSSLQNKENDNKLNLMKNGDFNFFKSKHSKDQIIEKSSILKERKITQENIYDKHSFLEIEQNILENVANGKRIKENNNLKKDRRRNNTVHVGTTKNSDLSPGFVKS
jgi:hypothetical protein